MKKAARNINSGIVVTGGSLKAEQIVVGDGATMAIQTTTQDLTQAKALSELASRVDELITLMRHDPSCISAGVDSAAETIRKELAEPKPNKLVVTSMLDSISKHASSVNTITTCLDGIRNLANAFL